ncbi:hypothetical protein ORD22_01690 [Sporosarcina sp. GW1-11]|uniref:TolB family protein n=1 Tax=Sporosarcina sp. GW1-11 TaxID=2899126 RepID=UPI00294D0B22|nr:hypothetical protein [Sporosarcina sp. GW1-11]MDV6376975.1 hypothetical protein [Sporosarcina sp. GW1-11]
MLNRTNTVGGAKGVTVINGSEKQLTSTTDYDTQPSWKGNTIAFTRDNNIFTMKPDGSGQQQIVANASQPALSEDGHMIAYVQEKTYMYQRQTVLTVSN